MNSLLCSWTSKGLYMYMNMKIIFKIVAPQLTVFL